jgi:hypothetical protein
VRRTAFALAASLFAFALPAAPAAAVVTVGPTLGSSTADHHPACESGTPCLVAQKTPAFTVPVTGTIVTWRVKGATGLVGLRVLDGNKSVSGTVVESTEGGKSVFPAAVPVEAGERIGLILAAGAKVGAEDRSGASFSAWIPALEFGEAHAPTEDVSNVELLVNVDVQPAPGITGVTPISGPTDGTTTVTISGHDFKEVTAVSFGLLPVEFEVESETEIIAHVSFGFAGAVPVTVTAKGGTTSLPDAFTFEEPPAPTFPEIPPVQPVGVPPISPVDLPPLIFPAAAPECHVPKLKGKTLKQAKQKLVAAHCKLGKVTERNGVKAAGGKVVSEVPPAGAPAPANARVAVKLG